MGGAHPYCLKAIKPTQPIVVVSDEYGHPYKKIRNKNVLIQKVIHFVCYF